MKPYPLQFEPILKERVWGGSGLAGLGKRLPTGKTIGESWELADLPAEVEEGRSRIANGPWKGRTLREAIAEHGAAVMGQARLTPEGGFPLLIKYLDAAENLSVQVHPTAAYASAHPGAHLKSEAWVVMDAAPGSVIYRGLKPGVTRDRFESHLRDGNIREDLNAIEVKPGECHYLPSGTCHALGKGILVAEIQTPSDTTFRVYDWGRTGRTLHVKEALACIDFEPAAEAGTSLPRVITTDAFILKPLAATEFFEIERIEARRHADHEITPQGMPEVWMVMNGAVRVRWDSDGEQSMDVGRGSTVLIPAGLVAGVAQMERGAAVLRITLPSPLKGKIA